MTTKIIPQSGEFYWIRGDGGTAFIAEYQGNNRDRNGCEAGPCFWVGITEFSIASVEIVEHIRRPA